MWRCYLYISIIIIFLVLKIYIKKNDFPYKIRLNRWFFWQEWQDLNSRHLILERIETPVIKHQNKIKQRETKNWHFVSKGNKSVEMIYFATKSATSSLQNKQQQSFGLLLLKTFFILNFFNCSFSFFTIFYYFYKIKNLYL